MRLKLDFTLIILILFMLPAVAFADQRGSVTAKVSDAELVTLPVAGAIVEFTPTANPANKLYYSTDGAGVVSVPSLQYGDYTISVSFLGYETAVIPFKLDCADLLLPEVRLKTASVQMEAVVKTTKALRASQKGDTLNYNASSFKVAADADVEGLLEKMPGIAIEDGTVTAQGEEIKKIYVDGREFFGGDVATALKSLPAEVVSRIEVYDKLSDSAEQSGMDDGEGEKTINIVTHKHMRKGVFGKVFAGGGYEPNPYDDYGDLKSGKYMFGGSLNMFHNTSRISVIGLSNNLNQQNFSFEDIMGVTEDTDTNSNSFTVKSLPGVANVNAVGVNYSDVFGENDKVKVQASYFFNKMLVTNEATMTRWYDESYSDEVTIIDSLHQSTYKITENINHRLNGRIDWKINEKSNITFRPTLSLQTNTPYSYTEGMRYDASQADEDSYTSYNRYDLNGNRIYGQQAFANNSSSYWGGFNVGTSANYYLRLGKAGRGLSAGGGFYVNKYDYTGDYNNMLYWDWENGTTGENNYIDYYTFTDSPSFRRNINANLGYTEPIVENWTLNLTYRFTQSYQETEKSLYETDDTYNPATGEFVDDSSNTAESTYNTQRIGPGFRFGKNKSSVTANVFYQSSSMINETISEGEVIPIDKTFENIVYSMVTQANFNPQNNLRINFYSYTSNPYISRLQNILNNPSSDYITKGNSNLNPSYSNQLRMRYTHSNLEKARSFMFMLSGTLTNNYNASHIVTQPNDFYFGDDFLEAKDQYTTWVNLDGYWNFNSRISYGLPLDFMKCNLNFNLGVSYSIIPSIFGGTVEDYTGDIVGGYENNTDKITYKGGFTLGSNISENVDFTLKWWGNYNEATNIAAADEYIENVNKYYDQTASLNLKVVFLKGFTFTGGVIYKQYYGISDPYNVQYTIVNAFVGHKVLKSKRGEINVGVNDALDQNTSFSRYIGSNYTQNTENITIGRYFSAQFIYNLRYFGKGGSTNIKDYKGMDRYSDGGSKKSQQRRPY